MKCKLYMDHVGDVLVFFPNGRVSWYLAKRNRINTDNLAGNDVVLRTKEHEKTVRLADVEVEDGDL